MRGRHTGHMDGCMLVQHDWFLAALVHASLPGLLADTVEPNQCHAIRCFPF